jgi:polysaccharide transporter, PST family
MSTLVAPNPVNPDPVGEDKLRIYFSDNNAESGHGRKSLHGGAMTLGARAINAVIQIGSVLFLARLLAPEDYGLVAMVTAITGFAIVMVDLGTRDAIVQRPTITKGEISALFWVTMAMGCGFALIVAAASPLIAKFYGDPRLKMINAVSAVTFITSSLTCQHYALMRRAMKFRELGIIEIIANVASAAIAIAAAYMGFHYWALVIRPIAMTTLLAAGLWLYCRWLPGKPTIDAGVKEMVKFGLNTAGFTIADYGVSRSTDRIVIGYNNGAKSLGFYQNAIFVYNNLLDVLVLPLHAVAVSSLSKLRGNMIEYRRLWSKALSMVAFYAMPAFGLLAVTSQDLIVIMLGAKWAKTGLLLSILALRGIPHCVERTVGWLHVSSGRSDRWMRYGIVAACGQIIALFAGLRFGVNGVVTAYVAYMFLLFLPAITYAGKPLNIGASDVVKVVWRQMLATAIVTIAGFYARHFLIAHTSPFITTVLLILSYLGLYLVVVVGIMRVRMPVGVVLQLLRDFLPPSLRRFIKTPAFIERHAYEHI